MLYTLATEFRLGTLAAATAAPAKPPANNFFRRVVRTVVFVAGSQVNNK